MANSAMTIFKNFEKRTIRGLAAVPGFDGLVRFCKSILYFPDKMSRSLRALSQLPHLQSELERLRETVESQKAELEQYAVQLRDRRRILDNYRKSLPALLQRLARITSTCPQTPSPFGVPTTVSVVIVTHNRAHCLLHTLEALRYQLFTEFEVIVVNGNSADETETILDKWYDHIKIAQCPENNQAMARNIGLAMAAGDIVAFLDDVEVPEATWLSQLVAGFDSPWVAAVGGTVFDQTGIALQERCVCVSRNHEVMNFSLDAWHGNCFPQAFWFPVLIRGQAAFRRQALLAIDGYNEALTHPREDVEVCKLLVDQGFSIRMLADAFTHRRFAPADIPPNGASLTTTREPPEQRLSPECRRRYAAPFKRFGSRLSSDESRVFVFFIGTNEVDGVNALSGRANALAGQGHLVYMILPAPDGEASVAFSAGIWRYWIAKPDPVFYCEALAQIATKHPVNAIEADALQQLAVECRKGTCVKPLERGGLPPL